MSLVDLELYGLRVHKLSILKELREKLFRLASLERYTQKNMLAVVPKKARYFIENYSVIESLIDNGHCFVSLRYGDSAHGLGNKEEMFSAIAELAKAWENNVETEFRSDGPDNEATRAKLFFMIANKIS